MASLGGTVLERITSDISRFSGMSSLKFVSREERGFYELMAIAYRLEEVARSICSSSAPVLEDPNQPAMMS